MICDKCGKKIKAGTLFCGNCGNKVEVTAETEIKKKKSPLSFIIIGVILILAIIAVVVFVVKSNPKDKYENQLEIAERFLNDMDYEAAVAAYKAAIEIDPKKPDAIIGLTDAYIAWINDELDVWNTEIAEGRISAALSALDDAEKLGADEELIEEQKSRIEKLRKIEIDTDTVEEEEIKEEETVQEDRPKTVAEEEGWVFSEDKPSGLKIDMPGACYYKDSKLLVPKDKLELICKWRNNQPEIEEKTTADGKKQITIEYGDNIILQVTDYKNHGTDNVAYMWKFGGYQIYDMYTGKQIYWSHAPESSIGDVLIEWNNKTWDISCAADVNENESKWSNWKESNTDNSKYREKSDYSTTKVTITCPVDYDGLCLVYANPSKYHLEGEYYNKEDGTIAFGIPGTDNSNETVKKNTFGDHDMDEFFIYRISELIK